MTLRDDLFNSTIAILGTCDKLKGEDGTYRVYDYPKTAPPGFPYAVVSSESFESIVQDNARDSRRYKFLIQVIGEKYGDESGLSQSDALKSMRQVEDQIMSAFDAKNGLNNGSVIRTMPVLANYGVNSDNGARVVLSITLAVDTMVDITI